ncbi:MAG: sigma-54 dependent transcriptional regulator [Candidatus Auribacterota bacterium]|nr:sigma-54 dependent transcriptional regulator [Candidatus Auribacterota bacterium]
MKNTILIVDDEKNLREGLAEALQSPSWKILLAENGFQAEEIIRREAVDLVLSDLKMPTMTGLELLKKVQAFSPTTIFIIMTAYGTVDTAVEAIKEGAYDYLTKPINIDQLELLLSRALERRELEAENIYLKEQMEKRFGLENMIGHSPAMERVFEMIRQISPSNATVLITGKSGTGKELVARAIHQLSPRRGQPFIPIHCAALSPSLLESELFGHEKGAFTGAISKKKGKFEVSDGGTIFLDEINEIPLEMQVKLLRFLEMRDLERVGGTRSIRVDVRLLAASNADLEALVEEKRLREDLYYRLNVVRIILPLLRERREDIPLLVHAFINEFSRMNRKEVTGIAPPALHALQLYDWPGNVRELRNCIESMVVLAKKPMLEESDIPPPIRIPASPNLVLPGEESLNIKTMEKELIRGALERASGNKKRAAELLGISRRTLYRKLEEYGLTRLKSG